jgi:hypothetical protein
MERKDLKAQGLTEEQITAVLELHHAEFTQVKEKLKTAEDDLKVAQDKVKTTEKALKAFEGVDVNELNGQIKTLKNDLKETETKHARELAERDFNDMLKDSISAAHGRNAKAITALLDVDTLKASKNQKDDVAAALKKLSEAEDSKMLFGDAEVVDTGNVIGQVHKSTPADVEEAAMRAAMGLAPVSDK